MVDVINIPKEKKTSALKFQEKNFCQNCKLHLHLDCKLDFIFIFFSNWLFQIDVIKKNAVTTCTLLNFM